MSDPFADFVVGLNSPPADGGIITPSDSVDIDPPLRGLLVQTTGPVRVTLRSGAVVPIPTLAAGVMHPGLIVRVWATDTDVGIIAGFR
jgi:hypothetical protein